MLPALISLLSDCVRGRGLWALTPHHLSLLLWSGSAHSSFLLLCRSLFVLMCQRSAATSAPNSPSWWDSSANAAMTVVARGRSATCWGRWGGVWPMVRVREMEEEEEWGWEQRHDSGGRGEKTRRGAVIGCQLQDEFNLYVTFILSVWKVHFNQVWLVSLG